MLFNKKNGKKNKTEEKINFSVFKRKAAKKENDTASGVTEEAANQVVSFGREQRCEVHCHVKQQEEYEKTARYGHHEFSSQRRFNKKTIHNFRKFDYICS